MDVVRLLSKDTVTVHISITMHEVLFVCFAVLLALLCLVEYYNFYQSFKCKKYVIVTLIACP